MGSLAFIETLLLREDFYVNVLAGLFILVFDIVITYLIISRVIDLRQNRKWMPARRQLVEHLLILHQLVMQAAQESLRYNIKKDLDETLPEEVRFNGEWFLREAFVQPLRFHFSQFEKLMNLYNVSLNSEILSDLAEYYTRCDTLIEFVGFAVLAFKPEHFESDFCCPAPYAEISELEMIVFRLQEATGARLYKMYETEVSAQKISENLRETETKHSRLHLTEVMKSPGGKGQLIVPNADIVRKIRVGKGINQIRTLARTSAIR